MITSDQFAAVSRFDFNAHYERMNETPDGGFVRFEDYKHLLDLLNERAEPESDDEGVGKKEGCGGFAISPIAEISFKLEDYEYMKHIQLECDEFWSENPDAHPDDAPKGASESDSLEEIVAEISSRLSLGMNLGWSFSFYNFGVIELTRGTKDQYLQYLEQLKNKLAHLKPWVDFD